MYQLVNRAGKLVGAFTDRVMDEQKYRNCSTRNLQAFRTYFCKTDNRTVLTKTLMHAKNEQLAVVEQILNAQITDYIFLVQAPEKGLEE